jgi:hypothetical protein
MVGVFDDNRFIFGERSQELGVIVGIGRTDHDERPCLAHGYLCAKRFVSEQRRQPDGVHHGGRALIHRQKMTHRERAERFSDQRHGSIRTLGDPDLKRGGRIVKQPSALLVVRTVLEFRLIPIGVFNAKDIRAPFLKQILRVEEERHVAGVTEPRQEDGKLVRLAFLPNELVRDRRALMAVYCDRFARCHWTSSRLRKIKPRHVLVDMARLDGQVYPAELSSRRYPAVGPLINAPAGSPR